MEFRQTFLRNTLSYLEFVRQLIYIQKFKRGLVRPTLKITLEGITSDQFTFNLSKPLMSHILVTRVAQLYQINHLGVILKSPFLNWTVHQGGE